ncbi:putative phage protein (predicted DNA packaging) [Anaerosolibacter carboniphilus]|uniref:Putative phage protein (Predicted DNA packaging) n=1 Tax=Anaerosolibacter carboniphilus TaxID=1417629 RepID=A0A841L0S5_9FIRM|nr:head-tail connector protein [Anaerosolibacter carboniphilus]MBB6218188.1 putative phage protein (predicted DNA packaging) [Anaerosolibacter carboniphilus]
MDELEELKEWLRIDGEEDDNMIQSLQLSSKLLIKQFTGAKREDVEGNSEALELYKLVQRLIVTDLYENRAGSNKMSPVLISLCTQLGAYKLQGGTV